MEILQEWLSPETAYLESEAFLAAMEKAAAPVDRDATRDAAGLFDSLLGPLDELRLSTRLWTQFFVEEGAAESIDASPAEAREYALKRLRLVDQVPGHLVSTLAEASFRLGRYAEAELATTVAYLAGDRSPATLTLLFGLALRSGRLAEADEALKQAQQLHPDLPEVRFCTAIRALHRGRVRAAVRELAGLLKAAPGYRPAWRLLLDALAQDGRWDELVRWGRKATAAHPHEPALWRRLARGYRAKGEPKKARAAIGAALEAVGQSVGIDDETATELRLEAARLEEEMGETERALRTYRALLDEGYARPAVFINAASCLKGAGRVEDCVSVLRRGLGANPDDPDLLTNLGEVLFERVEDAEAFEALQRAAEQGSGRPGNLILMATLCLRNRRPETAIELASAAARQAPERLLEALVIIGDAHRFRGAVAASREAYGAALELAPRNAEVAARVRVLESSSGCG